MRTAVLCFAIVFIISGATSSYATSTADDGSSLGKDIQEAANLRAEVERLRGVIATKDKALDIAITEIRKMRAEGNKVHDSHPVLTENAEMVAAFSLGGWEPVEFQGVGVVTIKAHSDVTIVRVPQGAQQTAQTMLAAKARAHYACGGQHCFVIPNTLLSK